MPFVKHLIVAAIVALAGCSKCVDVNVDMQPVEKWLSRVDAAVDSSCTAFCGSYSMYEVVGCDPTDGGIECARKMTQVCTGDQYDN